MMQEQLMDVQSWTRGQNYYCGTQEQSGIENHEGIFTEKKITMT